VLNLAIVINCSAKALYDVQGRPAISYTIDRIKSVEKNVQLLVIDTGQIDSALLATYCRRTGTKLAQFKGLGASCLSGMDYVAFIDAQNMFFDAMCLRDMLAIAKTGIFDYLSNVEANTLVKGTAINVLSRQLFDRLETKLTTALVDSDIHNLLNTESIECRSYFIKSDYAAECSNVSLSLNDEAGTLTVQKVAANVDAPLHTLGLGEILTVAQRGDSVSPWQGEVGPLLIAEIGGNHEGDFDVAKHMLDLAIKGGADSVKFQLYQGSSLVSPVESPDRYRHFKKFELTREQHIYLAEACREANVSYSASVWDMDMLDWIDPYLDFYKIGSGDVTAWPILANFAAREKPILLSTGLSTLEEVVQTVRFIQQQNPKYSDPNMLCVMQCTSMYPIPDEDANLRTMDAIERYTGAAIGYSDHTIGMDALLAAAAMGAKALEFHFTDSREGKEFRDHKVSLVSEEVAELKSRIAKINAFRGNGVKVPQPSELENKHEVSFRRAAYLNRPVKAGETIQPEDIVCLRPVHGIDARDADILFGAKALRDLEAFTALQIDSDLAH